MAMEAMKKVRWSVWEETHVGPKPENERTAQKIGDGRHDLTICGGGSNKRKPIFLMEPNGSNKPLDTRG